MNPSGYCGRGRGCDPAFALPGMGRLEPSAAALCQRNVFVQGEGRGYRQQQLSQRSWRHSPGQAHARVPDDLEKAFSLLRTNPGDALDAAEVLLDKYSAHPSPYVPVFVLKARALFQLGKIDDCIAFINSLETRLQHDKGLLMAKGRALQSRGGSVKLWRCSNIFMSSTR